MEKILEIINPLIDKLEDIKKDLKEQYALAIITRQDGFIPRGNIKQINNSTVGISLLPVKFMPFGLRIEINPKFNNKEVIEMLKDTIAHYQRNDDRLR